MHPGQPAQPDPLVIDQAQAGCRLDRAVADWRGLSRAAVLRLLDAGALSLSGRVLTGKDKGTLLSVGDRIELAAGFAGGEAPLPDADMPLAVLAQGQGWVAIDKPAGVAVRPHDLTETGTVLNAVAARLPQVVGVGEGGLRSGVVHRLDTDTSGTLLIAYEDKAWQRLRDAFAQHRIRKRYLALVHGTIEDKGEVTLPLRVARHSPSFVEVCESSDTRLTQNDARDCSLCWTVVERFNRKTGTSACLVEVDLHTGFLHQVRVTFAHLGCPVIGDRLYGEPQRAPAAPRQMLHAASLSLEEIEVAAPLPDDFEATVRQLREA